MNPDTEVTRSRELLHEGVRHFHNDIFQKNRSRYETAAREAQKPHTLFITCADSRVSPETITQSAPGQIFVTRNIGNLVPAYGEMVGGVSAVIEYAVAHLKVSQVVVCGHSDCGAMKGLLARDSLESLPTVDRWLNNADAALSIVRARNPHGDKYTLLDKLIQENVLLQMHHLQTHPAVAGRLAEDKLALYAWVYEIGEGLVKEYQPERKEFVSVL